MTERASKSLQDNVGGTRKRQAKDFALKTHGSLKENLSGNYLLQRKTKCACGGGCPTCREKSNLNISQPNDPLEIEADQIADQIMRMPVRNIGLSNTRGGYNPGTQRKCNACEDDNEPLQRIPQSLGDVSGNFISDSGAGRPLDHATRDFFEPRFGRDLGHVRIHTGPQAAESARSVNARAYTSGCNVVFGEGQYYPGTEAGNRLIAHELAHTLQQHKTSGRVYRTPDWEDVTTGSRLESFRDRAGATARMRRLESANPGREYHIVQRGRKFVIQSRPRPSATPAAPSPAPDAGTTSPTPVPDAGTPIPAPAPDAGTTSAPDAETAQDAGTGGSAAGCRGTKVFALTFDDGPHSAGLGTGNNLTENVLNTLNTKGLRGKAGFFIQTAAVGRDGRAMRGSTRNGRLLVERMHREGYAIGIHTGGTADHESHSSAFRAGRLRAELTAAETYIHGITGSDPDYVRAPFGDTGRTAAERTGIAGIYSALGLTHLRWDIDGDPPPNNTNLLQLTRQFDTQLGTLHTDSCGYIPSTASSKIVVLYHDVRRPTAANIGDLIDHIRAVVPSATFDKA